MIPKSMNIERFVVIDLDENFDWRAYVGRESVLPDYPDSKRYYFVCLNFKSVCVNGLAFRHLGETRTTANSISVYLDPSLNAVSRESVAMAFEKMAELIRSVPIE